MILKEVVVPLLLVVALLWLMPIASGLLAFVWIRGSNHSRNLPATPLPPHLLILVPAHDEVLLIGHCVASLLALRRQRVSYRVVVVADNCHDDTAEVARHAGAEVLERTDPALPGKPAAIAWALARIGAEPYDALVIIDADTTVDPGFAEALIAQGPLSEIALQARFGVSNPGETWLTRLASLWVDVRYDRQFMRKARAGFNVVLTGNGMCLGREWLARVGWVAVGLTEDLALYARATTMGERIGFAGEARLYAQEAPGLGTSLTQRQRWQAGRWEVLAAEAGPLLRSNVISVAQKLDALSELMLPGPVLHTATAISLATVLFLAGGPLGSLLAGLFVLSVLPLVSGTLAALVRRPDRGQLALDLFMLPIYSVWRLAVGISARFNREQKVWRRSPRHAPPPAP